MGTTRGVPTRVFGGKTYQFAAAVATQRQAKLYISKLRETGYNVRAVKQGQRIAVYVNPVPGPYQFVNVFPSLAKAMVFATKLRGKGLLTRVSPATTSGPQSVYSPAPPSGRHSK